MSTLDDVLEGIQNLSDSVETCGEQSSITEFLLNYLTANQDDITAMLDDEGRERA